MCSTRKPDIRSRVELYFLPHPPSVIAEGFEISVTYLTPFSSIFL
jgi:hypothetical protein